MNIQQIDIGLIKPYAKNPRKNKAAVDTVKASLKEFGFKQPIVVDKDMTIVVGHTRFTAAKELDYQTVPVVVADELSAAQIKAYRIMDNRSNENASWDDELLAEEMKSLEGDIDLLLTGFTEDQIRFMLDESMRTEDEKDNKVPDIKKDVKTKSGDLWHLGNHKLICGSATDPIAWSKVCAEETAKLVFTSPPYNMGGGLYDEYSDDKASDEYIEFNNQVVECALMNLKGFLMYNISYNRNARFEFIDVLYNIKKKMKFIELIVWRKHTNLPNPSNTTLNRKYEDIGVFSTDEDWEDIEWFSCHTTEKDWAFNRKTKHKITNLWEIDNKNVQENNHKAAFPVELPGRGIRLCTASNDLVVDPFGGTGTTLIAAEKYNRRAALIELSPVYCDLIIERWQTYTGQAAVRSDGVKWNDISYTETEKLENFFNLEAMNNGS
jgi:DNA modification methylase